MKVMVLGGDGFCGWPTALYLSKAGHDVLIIDNLSRRKIDLDLEVSSLTPIQPMGTRLNAWNEHTDNEVQFLQLDVALQYHRLYQTIKEYKPDAIVHFAEQRAAPYSMKSEREKRYTVENNLSATHNVLCAIVESGMDIHLVHLGTMGVYGYTTADTKIPEGYLNVQIEKDSGGYIAKEILYPVDPGSIYHMTKTQDQLFFYYYNKNNQVRITDLHQGVVWGTQTEETSLDDRLINRFDYDGDYGTVLNRFLMQAAIGYPLSVHGTGGQTRAFIHIRDTVRCIEIAINNSPNTGDRVKIFNQTTETHRVRELAQIVSSITGADIHFINNPRNEAEQNDLNVENKGFLELGLKPITLSRGLMQEIHGIAEKYSDRCDRSKIPCTSHWTKN